jgi:ABC-type nitrate/sulfonate/bicarbonate transport system permease component
MAKLIRTVILLRLTGLVAPLALWQLLSWIGILHPVFAPPPTKVLIRALLLPGEAASHFAITLGEIAVALILGSVGGVAIGVVLAQASRIDSVLGPVIWFVYAAPVVAFTTFFVVFLGVGPAVPVSLGVLSGIVFVIASTRDGVRQIGEELIKVGRVFGASRSELALRIIVPAAIPMIMAGMRVGVGRMLVGVIVGEFFASGGGLGFLIIKYGYELDMERVYAAVVWIVLVSLALNGVFGRVERIFDAWRTH